MNVKNRIVSLDEQSTDLITCPNCDKKSLHTHSVGHYQCIFCGFEKNLPLENSQNFFLTFVTVISAGLILLGGIYWVNNREVMTDLSKVRNGQVR
jgi:hypothetical protein